MSVAVHRPAPEDEHGPRAAQRPVDPVPRRAHARPRRRRGSPIRELIIDWRAAVPGRTVLLTTHYMAEADELCERIAIVDRGRILAIGTPARAEAARPARVDLPDRARPARRRPGGLGRLPGRRLRGPTAADDTDPDSQTVERQPRARRGRRARRVVVRARRRRGARSSRCASPSRRSRMCSSSSSVAASTRPSRRVPRKTTATRRSAPDRARRQATSDATTRGREPAREPACPRPRRPAPDDPPRRSPLRPSRGRDPREAAEWTRGNPANDLQRSSAARIRASAGWSASRRGCSSRSCCRS